MDVLTLAGYLALAFAGLVLGLVGGGGGLLTVPILTLLFGLSFANASGASLGIVGVASLVVGLPLLIQGKVQLKKTVIFLAPSALAAFWIRRTGLSLIPDPLWQGFSRDQALTVMFSVVLFITALKTLGRPKDVTHEHEAKPWILGIAGLVTGLVSGLLGAGGGFLIVPALTLLGGFAIHSAVRYSIVIIALQSLLGFAGELQRTTVSASQMLGFVSPVVLGLVVGQAVGQRIDGKALQRGFGFFLLVLAVALPILQKA